MRHLLRCLIVGIAVLAGLIGGGPADAAGAPSFPTDTLTIVSGTDSRHTFTVELATTENQRAWGLMFRESLARTRGMLFVYDRERRASMWMKNTRIPLDMIFIDRRGRVVGIHEHARPGSEKTIRSPEPVKAVLEVKAGTVDRLNIDQGDRVSHDIFAQNS